MREPPVDMHSIPFERTDWPTLPASERPGATGTVRSRPRQLRTIRVRMVEYSPGYLTDHWCEKGHILLCVEGTLQTELADGTTVELLPGICYQVSDGTLSHPSSTPTGASLFIVD